MSDSFPLVIEGKHTLTNPSFKLAVLKVALEQLGYLEKDEYPALILSGLIVKQLGLPMGEKMLVLNVIAPKETITRKANIEEAIAIVRASMEIDSTPIELDFQEQQEQINRTQRIIDIKKRVLEAVNELKVIPESYLEAKFGEELKKVSLSLPNLLNSFGMNELMFIDHFVAAPGYEASQFQLNQLLLEENGHRPFNANILSKRYALTLEETFKLLRKRKFGDLILWNSFQVWSITDVKVSPVAKQRIKKNVAKSNGKPLLLYDIFHIIMVGVVAENSYEDIDVSVRKECAYIGLHEAGIFGYDFDATDQKFYLSSHTDKEKEKPMYKVFGRK